MKSRIFHLLCLFIGEGLLFGTFHFWLPLAVIFLSTVWIVCCPCETTSLMPDTVLRKTKIGLALIFWTAFFFSLYDFIRILQNLCLDCKQWIQSGNALHFWDVQNPSVLTWAKNVYHTYPQPILLFSALFVVGIGYILSKKAKGKR